MTTYVILRSMDDHDEAWVEVQRKDARSDVAALRALGLPNGLYVAVPLRSWRPRTVRAEQTTRLTIT